MHVSQFLWMSNDDKISISEHANKTNIGAACFAAFGGGNYQNDHIYSESSS